VIAYVRERTGMKRSRATIYNWTTKGIKVGGEVIKLPHAYSAGQMVTKKLWIDVFLTKVDQR